ncbi:MAG: group III truncated hemoglobin [Verrucomicrobiota bacterium]
MKTDIHDEADVEKLVHAFYEKVNDDALLAPIFNHVANVNWENHLQLLCRFWNTLLFRTMTFEGKPFPKHAILPLEKGHFTRWVFLFTSTVDELFAGAKAEEAKGFARSIADTFQLRMGLRDEAAPLKFFPA